MQSETGETCEIIFRDEHIVAINKPAGLLVHRSPIDRHETRFALQLVRNQVGQHVYPVHRLDKPTSGVLLFGLSSAVARRVSEQFARRQVGKRYLAVVRGHCPESGCIDHPLLEKLDRIADRGRLGANQAEAALDANFWRVIEACGWQSVVAPGLLPTATGPQQEAG